MRTANQAALRQQHEDFLRRAQIRKQQNRQAEAAALSKRPTHTPWVQVKELTTDVGQTAAPRMLEVLHSWAANPPR